MVVTSGYHILYYIYYSKGRFMNNKIKEIDNEIFFLSEIKNIINWDSDFVSTNKNNKDKIEIINYINKQRNEKIKRIIEDSNIILNAEEKIFFNELQIDYIVNNNSPELEAKLNETIFNLKNKYAIARNNKDFSLLLNEFSIFIDCYIAFFNKKELIGQTTYEKAFNCFYQKVSYKTFKDIVYSLKESLPEYSSSIKTYCETKPTEKNELILIELQRLFNVEMDVISFHKDDNNSLDFLSKSDIRITLNYNVNNYMFIKSFLHEYGHALYLLNISDDIHLKCLQLPFSKEFDEGNAKFMEKLLENQKFKKYFEIKFGIGLNPIYDNSSRITSNSIDYLKLCVARVIIEEDLLNNRITVFQVKDKWKKEIKRLFGDKLIIVDDSLILDDPHWFFGQLFYYQSYILSYIYTQNLYKLSLNKLDYTKIDKQEFYEDLKSFLRNFQMYGKTKNIEDIFSEKYGIKIDYSITFK